MGGPSDVAALPAVGGGAAIDIPPRTMIHCVGPLVVSPSVAGRFTNTL